MNIVAINGSPNAEGISAQIIRQMEELLGGPIQTHHAMRLVRAASRQETVAELLQADILLVVSPLFVDSLPSPLIELLTVLERAACHSAKNPRVYAIINGAFESSQTALALEMAAHFASRAGLPWGYGIGIGAGSMLYSAGENWENGVACDVHHALRGMSAAIRENGSGQNVFAASKFPSFLYNAIANIRFWLIAKRNGANNLRARPYI